MNLLRIKSWVTEVTRYGQNNAQETVSVKSKKRLADSWVTDWKLWVCYYLYSGYLGVPKSKKAFLIYLSNFPTPFYPKDRFFQPQRLDLQIITKKDFSRTFYHVQEDSKARRKIPDWINNVLTVPFPISRLANVPEPSPTFSKNFSSSTEIFPTSSNPNCHLPLFSLPDLSLITWFDPYCFQWPISTPLLAHFSRVWAEKNSIIDEPLI